MISLKAAALAATGALILGGAGVFGVHQALAQTGGTGNSFVSQLAQSLGIDQSKVQQAVNQVKQNNQTKAQANYTQMLDQAVADGKITDAQKQLILQKRQELLDWSKQNNISLRYVIGMHGMRGMKTNNP